jgi:hypothetical protein
MTSRLSPMEKIGTFLDETIHITPRCTMRFHGHRNKMVPLMKPFIFVDLSNGVKFHNYTCYSIDDIRSHYLPRQVNNHHINNKDLILSSHVDIGL